MIQHIVDRGYHIVGRPFIKLIPLIIMGAYSTALSADSYLDAQKEFDAYQRQSDAQFQRTKDEFEIYKLKLQQAFKRYRAESEKIWGRKNTVMPERRNWVSYIGDLHHRSVVDFEAGTITVEVAFEQRTADNATRNRELARTIVSTLNQGGDRRSMLELADKPIAQGKGDALLAGQVAGSGGQPATEDQYKALASQAADHAQQRRITGRDGKTRFVYRAQLTLVPDHIRRRAQRFQQQIHTHAEGQAMPAALIFAVTETESMFNPNARSPAPAFGLMQLVPGSGAREAYRYLYRQDKVVSDTYLYNPDNNLRLGAAFLNRLYYHYFSGIDNDQSRLWATVAAYNTGAGNVFRTFAGSYSRARYGTRDNWKRAALKEINRRSPEQVYTYMRQHLPYSETRRYLHSVRSRMSKYRIDQGT